MCYENSLSKIILVAITATQDLLIHRVDVETTFLNVNYKKGFTGFQLKVLY